MNQFIFKGLDSSYTAYQATEYAINACLSAGFTRLYEDGEISVAPGGKYFIVRNDSALIAFTVGDLSSYSFKIVASHVDSPALKLKYNPVISSAGVKRLNAEVYGGAIWSTFLDVPLKIAGRLVLRKGNRIYTKAYVSDAQFVIPNLAIHLNREINDGYKYNPQVDLSPVAGIDVDADFIGSISSEGESVVGYDLYAVNSTGAFIAGADNSLICSRGLDNRVCAFASLYAMINAPVGSGVNVCYLADNEEIGSRTAEGADSDFLKKTLKSINRALSKTRSDFEIAIAKSFMVSADNAHAAHPSHPELSDPTNLVTLGGGVVIKHHANKNYTTDGLTGAVFEQMMKDAGVKTQSFFMRSDLRCGSTLGTIANSQLAIKSVDIGIGQLAMHSSMETAAVKDCDSLVQAMQTFYERKVMQDKGAFEI